MIKRFGIWGENQPIESLEKLINIIHNRITWEEMKK